MKKQVGSIMTSIDELFLARKWCFDKCHMDKETFFKQFGVPIELDYLE